MFGLTEPKHVAEFLVLITNICCVYWLNKLLYYYKTQRDGSYQNKKLHHRQLTWNVTMWRFRPLLSWQKKNVLSLVAPHMSLATLKGTLRFSCKMPDILSDFRKIWIFSIDIHKRPSVKFRDNSPSGSRALICGQMEKRTDRRTWRY
jgi:hypothetical protein